MQESGIPELVMRFLATHIYSIEQIEVLLLLLAAPDREWSAAEVSSELRSSVASIRDRLDDLASRGFLAARVAETGRLYRYAPSTEDTRRGIEGLATAYRERRFSIINLVYSRPESDVESFAEAFKLGRKREDR